MKSVVTCPHCGSFDVVQDANYYPNTGDHSHFDNMECTECSYDGHSFNWHEVPDDFNPANDKLPDPTVGSQPPKEDENAGA